MLSKLCYTPHVTHVYYWLGRVLANLAALIFRGRIFDSVKLQPPYRKLRVFRTLRFSYGYHRRLYFSRDISERRCLGRGVSRSQRIAYIAPKVYNDRARKYVLTTRWLWEVGYTLPATLGMRERRSPLFAPT